MTIESGQPVLIKNISGAISFRNQADNANLTLPIQIKIVQFTRDMTIASGNQAVTGVGFQPKVVIFLAASDQAGEASTGFDDGTVHLGIRDLNNVTADLWGDADNSIFLKQTAVIAYYGSITTLGADGFTVTWTKVGLKTGTATITALCIG